MQKLLLGGLVFALLAFLTRGDRSNPLWQMLLTFFFHVGSAAFFIAFIVSFVGWAQRQLTTSGSPE